MVWQWHHSGWIEERGFTAEHVSCVIEDDSRAAAEELLCGTGRQGLGSPSIGGGDLLVLAVQLKCHKFVLHSHPPSTRCANSSMILPSAAAADSDPPPLPRECAKNST